MSTTLTGPSWEAAQIASLRAEVDRLRDESERRRRIAYTLACAIAVDPACRAIHVRVMRVAENDAARSRTHERRGELGPARVARDDAEIRRAAAELIEQVAGEIADMTEQLAQRVEGRHA